MCIRSGFGGLAPASVVLPPASESRSGDGGEDGGALSEGNRSWIPGLGWRSTKGDSLWLEVESEGRRTSNIATLCSFFSLVM